VGFSASGSYAVLYFQPVLSQIPACWSPKVQVLAFPLPELPPLLIRFRVENFRSIRDEQELSLVASPLSEHPEAVVRAGRFGVDLLRTAAIYGPNASGKSTVMHALEFMKSAVSDSQRTWAPDAKIPRSPFALDASSAAEPSLWGVDLLLGGVRYEYGFVADDSRILEEWLYAYPRGRKQEWFTRDASRGQEFEFSRLLKGENRAISGFTRPNSLFLSAAAQNNHAMLAPVYRWFSANLLVTDEQDMAGRELAASQICISETGRVPILGLLESADLGITGLDVDVDDFPTFADRWNIRSDTPEWREYADALPRVVTSVQLRHRTKVADVDESLPFDQESRGTRVLFGLAGLIVATLQTGGVLVVDELDRSLHPQLAMKIVELFNEQGTNPKNAQLIFNTHDTNLLDSSLLRRDQVWFTEKGEDGATRLFPLTDFKARKHENLERGYLQGRYGAVPALGNFDPQQSAAD
jgi:hypothetical protein